MTLLVNNSETHPGFPDCAEHPCDETHPILLHTAAMQMLVQRTLQALRARPPPQSWCDAASDLDTWAVEYEDILSKIPATDRKAHRASPYKPQRWVGFHHSPIRTRSRCKQSDAERGPQGDGSDDGGDRDGYTPPSPTPTRSTRSARGNHDVNYQP
ncbi:hypothetical protein DHEL01_v211920 [Diaporthe helianthi]|uniref:Uncharacterized protein n=1 Tax=Diaporthe helianthi TaxID=158607 RepID=A0A2P5HHG0_DIAHE|nr:hypothetical protein DHEL01_v211920 [Diaporthe helianthi]